MPAFAYVARDNSGAMIEGEVTAPSQAEAAKIVRGEGKFVVRLGPKGTRSARARTAASSSSSLPSASPAKAKVVSLSRGDKYRPEDLIFFTNQLAVMVDTGVSLSEALDACRHGGNSPRFAKALETVIDQVNAGCEFSAALAEHPRVFPPIYVALIKASEASGMMGPMLERLARHIQLQRETSKKIKGAVTYPIVMFAFAIGVTVFLTAYVLPKFSTIYAGREDSLPIVTRFLMGFSSHMAIVAPFALAGLAGMVGAAVWYFRTPQGRLRKEAIQLRMPLIGPMFHKTYLARSLHTLGTMIQSGVSVLDGVRLTAEACGSLHYRQMWLAVHDRLETGKQVSDALGEFEQVPKSVKKMLSAGERSGKLGPVMARVAAYCDSELGVAIKTFTAMLEPAIVMFLGVVVGGLVLALLLPIFTISKAMH
jgi:type IV pilus assembly protein PilC